MEGKEWLDKLRYRLGLAAAGSADTAWPDWYLAYHTAFATPARPVDSLLRGIPVSILDAETTGLDVKQDTILSIGALRVYGNSIHLAEKFEAYLPTPHRHQLTKAVTIHGIIPNSRRYTYWDEATLLASLLTYLGTDMIVGHHIGFDLEMINRALARHGAGPLQNRIIDTAELAKRLRPAGYWTPEGDYSLDALAKRYRIPLSDRHTALGDCYITAVLWLKLLTRLATKLGHDLHLQDL